MVRVIRPCFTDGLIGCDPTWGFKATREVAGGDEVGEVLPQLVGCLVMTVFDGRLLDGAVHPLDLAVGPWVTRFGEVVLDVEVGAGRFEGVAPEGQLLRPHFLDVLRRPAVTGRVGEVGAPSTLLRGGSGNLHSGDKWIADLIAAMLAASRWQDKQATAPEPQPGVQGQGGPGRRERREDAGRAGAAV